MTNTTGPQGSVSYATDPNSPSGYSQTTTLDPASQALLTQLQGLKGSSMMGLADATSQPFDLNAAGASKISDLQRTMLDPQWDQRKAAFDTDLLNRGIRPGSEQYDNMTRQFGQTRDDAYNKMFLDAYSQANNAAIQQREVPINDYLRISGLANPAQPTTPATPAPGVAPTDLSGDVYNSYNIAQQAYNQQMGGIYGLGGALVGAAGQAASNPATLAALGLSDSRLKMNIVKLRDDARGFAWYAFSFIWDLGRRHIGVMAQELAKTMPEAVRIGDDGWMRVDYGAL